MVSDCLERSISTSHYDGLMKVRIEDYNVIIELNSYGEEGHKEVLKVLIDFNKYTGFSYWTELDLVHEE